MTITDRLQAAGYGHTRTPNSTNTGKHTIFRLSDGRVVGHMTVFEAIEFLRGRP